jgi:type IV secretion system protein VirD4
MAVRPYPLTPSARNQARLLTRARHAAETVGRWTGAGVTAAVGLHFLADPLSVFTATLGLAGTVALGRCAARRRHRAGGLPAGVDALEAVRADAMRCGGGAFIGLLDTVPGGVLHAPSECAVLVFAPPRAGKTSSVIIPSVLSAPGAVLSTSTKPDVLMATARARSRYGTTYLFDPSGQSSYGLAAGIVPLRWSPLDAAGTWESARRLGQAMVAASPAAKGTRHESHWTSRAAALLGPLMYAAALDRRSMREVVSWVLSGSTKDADAVLMSAAEDGNWDALLAAEVLVGVERAATEERQSIWSATSDVLDCYTTGPALAAASRSNFDPAAFVRSTDTVYVASPAEHQASAAPLVVALVEAIRDAQYARSRAAAVAGEWPGHPVSLVLDEVANIAPLGSLPALVSEGGGQGLHVIAALQDLSQVRGRWGPEIAEGFLSLFQHVLVLGGIRDTRTLEALSLICGEWDRPQTSYSSSLGRSWNHAEHRWQRTTSWSTTTSTVRERRLTAGAIYGLAQGQALYLYGCGWRIVRLAAHYNHPRWQAALAAAPAQVVDWGVREPQPAEDWSKAPPAPVLRIAHSNGGGRAIQRDNGRGRTR